MGVNEINNRIIVIGAGPGGYVAAIRAAQLGADVTVIEKDHVGGTCLNWGCIPLKIMKTTADLLDHMNRASEFGIHIPTCGDMLPDMKRLTDRKAKIIQTQRDGILKLFKYNKIRYLTGNADLNESRSISVSLNNGESEEIAWDKLIIATGTRPQIIGDFPFDGKKILSSDDALYLTKIPESCA